MAQLRAALAAEQAESAATFRDLWGQLQALRKHAALGSGEGLNGLSGSAGGDAELREARREARELARENAAMHARLLALHRSARGEEVEELEDRLRDSQKALGRLKHENARLQVVASSRSPAARGGRLHE